jgi:hypothetical protein
MISGRLAGWTVFVGSETIREKAMKLKAIGLATVIALTSAVAFHRNCQGQNSWLRTCAP